MSARTYLVFASCFLGSAFAGWVTTHRGADQSEQHSSASTPADSAARTAPSAGNQRAKVAAAMAPVRAAKDRWAAMKAAVELAHRIPPEDIARWLNKDLFQHSDDTLETLFYRSLRDRYFELDPAACVCDLLARSDENTGDYLRRWAERDVEAVLRLAQGMPERKMVLLAPALTALAKRDPAATYAHLAELKLTGQNEAYRLSGVFSNLAESDPAGLLARSAEWNKQLGDVARNAAVNTWCKNDFNACLTWLEASPEGKTLLQGALSSPADGVGKQLLAHLHELPDGWAASLAKSGSYAFYAGNGEACLTADLEGAGIAAADAARIRSSAINSLAYSQPEKALAAYAALGELSPGERQSLVSNLASAIGGKNPELARQWAEGLDETLRAEALAKIDAAVERKSSSGKPVQPAEKLQAIIAGKLSPYQLGSYNGAMTQDQAAEAIRAIKALPAEQVTTLGDKAYSAGWPNAMSGELISRQLAVAPEADQKKLIQNASNTATRWAQEDPIAASKWASSLPDGDARHWAMLNLASAWNRDDPTAAERWIAKLPEKDRAAAREGLKPGKF